MSLGALLWAHYTDGATVLYCALYRSINKVDDWFYDSKPPPEIITSRINKVLQEHYHLWMLYRNIYT